MANFVLLKGGEQYKVFDFDGNVARVGSGEHVDLQIVDTGTESDIFLLMLTDKGYDLQPIAPDVVISVNGQLADKRVSLEEQAKVSFLDYLMIVTYGEQVAKQPQPSAAAQRPQAPTAQQMTSPSPSTPDERTRPLETPPKVDDAAAPGVPLKPQPSQGATPSQPATENLDQPTVPGGSRRTPEPAPPPPPPPANTEEQATVLIHHEPPPQLRPQAPVQEAPKPRIEPDYVLVGLSGQHAGKIFPIDAEEFVVGRARECNLVVERDERGQPESSISRQHFTITSREGELSLSDRHSKLRTYVNGKVLESDQREPIAPEDVISIRSPKGEIKFRICFADDPNPYPDDKKSFPWLPVAGLAAIIIILAFVLYKFLGTE